MEPLKSCLLWLVEKVKNFFSATKQQNTIHMTNETGKNIVQNGDGNTVNFYHDEDQKKN